MGAVEDLDYVAPVNALSPEIGKLMGPDNVASSKGMAATNPGHGLMTKGGIPSRPNE